MFFNRRKKNKEPTLTICGLFAVLRTYMLNNLKVHLIDQTRGNLRPLVPRSYNTLRNIRLPMMYMSI